jgi:2-phosphosulfolactate phosphatase
MSGLDVYSQEPYSVRLEWGRRGSRRAAARGDLRVVVDTLSFSSAVATAVHHGAEVYPCRFREDAADVAARHEAEVACRRGEWPAQGRYSLSPVSFIGILPGTRVVLPSPNGATCCRIGRGPVLVGCLLNASALARRVVAVAAGRPVTVVACGERWQERGEDGPLRVAIEDLLGAGAVIASLPGDRSPEARVAEAAFRTLRDELPAVLAECGSGRELIERGSAADVAHAASLDRYDRVPALGADGWLRGWTAEGSLPR